MNIKKGDKVVILKGRDKGKSGKVLKVSTLQGKIIVEGLNIVKKNVKARKQGEKGQIISTSAPMTVSKVMLICSACSKPSRVGYRITGDKKERICKKCKAIN